MNILEVNRGALANLYEQFPESFKGLRIQGQYLVYGQESCDISKFNIYDLINGSQNFSANLDTLTAEDIFRIIRLHTLSLESKDKNEEKLNIIKQENPLLRNVTIIPRNERTGKEEIINIVDSAGRDNMFVNTYRIDFFDVYEAVKAKNGSGEVTPEELIAEINRRIHHVDLESNRDLEERSNASEDYENKMRNVSEPYNSSNSINVYGNEDLDVAIVSDSRSKDDHEVITFDRNEFGDTVIENHKQDIQSQDTITRTNSSTTIDTEAKAEDVEEENIMQKDDIEDEIIPLISSEEFYQLLNSSEVLSAQQKQDVETYYAFLGDLMLYEEYLLPELMAVLNTFRSYILDLSVKAEEAEAALTHNQEDAMEKAVELEEKAVKLKDTVVNDELDYETTLQQANERTLKLERKYKNASEGFVSTFAIIVCILVVVIILTIITLSLV